MSHPGTYVNSPTLGVAGLVTGSSDTAVSFNTASNQYVVQNDTIAPQIFTAFTIGCIIKPAALLNGITVWGVDGNTDSILLAQNIDGAIRFIGVSNAGGLTEFALPGATPLVNGSTYLVVGTWDGTTARLYINAVADGTAAFSDPIDLVDAENFYFATDQFDTTGNASYTGVGAHAFFVRNVAASPAQITTINNAVNGTGDIASAINALSPYIYWPLNETSGTTAFDAASTSSAFRFTPPTENTVSNVAYDVPPIWNRLMRFYPTRKRGRAVWKLPNGTFTFDQPYPSTQDTLLNRESLFPAVPTPPSGLGTSTSNLTAVTYEYVYLGGHTYIVDATEEALLAAFLTAQGYTPSDWLVPA